MDIDDIEIIIYIEDEFTKIPPVSLMSSFRQKCCVFFFNENVGFKQECFFCYLEFEGYS